MIKQTIIVSLTSFFILVSSFSFAGENIGIGEPAPGFSLLSVDGDSITLSDVVFNEGKIVLLNFFGWN